MSEFQRQMEFRSAIRQIGGHGAPRNAAHDMDAELEPLSVDEIGQRTEAFGAGG
jgi:hypothetical protein